MQFTYTFNMERITLNFPFLRRREIMSKKSNVSSIYEMTDALEILLLILNSFYKLQIDNKMKLYTVIFQRCLYTFVLICVN